MILGFKKQFEQPILDDIKIHSFRQDTHNRWKKGRSIQMATGVRTKQFNCFKRDECKSVQEVHMSYAFGDIIEMTINGRYINEFSEKEQIAKNDGFKNWEEFFDWFYPVIKNSEDEFYVGKIIHWTDKRY
ncbi:MAG: hypothetical protein ABI207_03345 [Crocinitomicaceae bacterium]